MLMFPSAGMLEVCGSPPPPEPVSHSAARPRSLGLIMAGLMWIFCLFCVSVRHLGAALPVHLSVRVGQNATLSCNLNSSSEVTWYLLRADQLLPLLTVRRSRLNPDTVDGHAADMSRFSIEGSVESGSVSLYVLKVEQDDAGLYFCAGRCEGAVCVNRGIHLTVTGADGESAGGPRQQCCSLGICILPAFISLCLFFVAGFYLCTGKPVVCCCTSERRDFTTREMEEVSLHYSSLKHADKPRPSIPRRQDDVTYSAVTTRKKPDGSA